MQLQGPWCQHLALFDASQRRFESCPRRIRLIHLVRERDQGCTGCRMVCEVIPLLNDYCQSLLDTHKLVVHATGRLTEEDEDSTGEEDDDYFLEHGKDLDVPWSLTIEDEDGQWLGEFELFKTSGKLRDRTTSKGKRPCAYCYEPDETVPWSCVQDRPSRARRHVDSESEDAWKLITKWNSECRKEHDDCRPAWVDKGPSRLLHVGNGSLDSSHAIRLVICDVTAPPEYVALSHCWGKGKNKPPQTTRETIEQHLNEIKAASLSRSFRDAIVVCRHLKEQYLWIDSLCIIQDDDQDKANEIPRMQAIYEGAALTISAMSAHDGRGGCWIPGRREFDLPTEEGATVKLAFHRTPDPFATRSHAPFLSAGDVDNLYAQYPLATRKWTLQERVLSPRILHFAADDLVWECRASAYCSCKMADILPRDYHHTKYFDIVSDKETDSFEIVREWMNLVVSYSRAEISHHADIFPALAGLASGFSGKNVGKYCAGLWTTDLPITLCWHTTQSESKEATHSKFRFPKYVAPTWSWASVEGPLCFDAMDEIGAEPDSLKQIAEVLSVVCETESEFGKVRSGTLKIRTRICNVPPRSVATTTIAGWQGAEFRADTLDEIPRKQECVVALMIVKEPDQSQALVLVENGNGTYSRCGLVYLPDGLLTRFIQYMEMDIV